MRHKPDVQKVDSHTALIYFGGRVFTAVNVGNKSWFLYATSTVLPDSKPIHTDKQLVDITDYLLRNWKPART